MTKILGVIMSANTFVLLALLFGVICAVVAILPRKSDISNDQSESETKSPQEPKDVDWDEFAKRISDRDNPHN